MQLTTTSVLIVDDDADIRANVADILNDLGYETSTAADGPSALQLVREHRFDIAMLDFKMPGMDGLTLFRNIRQLHPDMDAFLVTAYTGEGVAESALQDGMVQVMRKPVDIVEVLRLIDEVTQNSARELN